MHTSFLLALISLTVAPQAYTVAIAQKHVVIDAGVALDVDAAAHLVQISSHQQIGAGLMRKEEAVADEKAARKRGKHLGSSLQGGANATTPTQPTTDEINGQFQIHVADQAAFLASTDLQDTVCKCFGNATDVSCTVAHCNAIDVSCTFALANLVNTSIPVPGVKELAPPAALANTKTDKTGHVTVSFRIDAPHARANATLLALARLDVKALVTMIGERAVSKGLLKPNMEVTYLQVDKVKLNAPPIHPTATPPAEHKEVHFFNASTGESDDANGKKDAPAAAGNSTAAAAAAAAGAATTNSTAAAAGAAATKAASNSTAAAAGAAAPSTAAGNTTAAAAGAAAGAVATTTAAAAAATTTAAPATTTTVAAAPGATTTTVEAGPTTTTVKVASGAGGKNATSAENGARRSASMGFMLFSMITGFAGVTITLTMQ